MFLPWYEIKAPKPEAIGRWLASHRGEYFAREVKEEIEKKYSDPFGLDPFPRIRKVKEIVDFAVTAETEYEGIRLTMEPRYPNLQAYEHTFILVLSRRALRFFWFMSYLIDSNWDKRELPEEVKWVMAEYPLSSSDTIQEFMSKRLTAFAKETEESLMRRFRQTEQGDKLGAAT